MGLSRSGQSGQPPPAAEPMTRSEPPVAAQYLQSVAESRNTGHQFSDAVTGPLCQCLSVSSGSRDQVPQAVVCRMHSYVVHALAFRGQEGTSSERSGKRKSRMPVQLQPAERCPPLQKQNPGRSQPGCPNGTLMPCSHPCSLHQGDLSVESQVLAKASEGTRLLSWMANSSSQRTIKLLAS